MSYQFQFGEILLNADLLLRGLKYTILLWLMVFPAALVLGMGLALMRIAGGWRNALASGYIEIFRNSPVLIQLIWFYYAFPVLTGLQMTAFQAAWLGLFLNTSAYGAEIWRAGLQSIHRGQWEAARALGMTSRRLLWRIVLPQAAKRMIPAFTNRGVEVAKMTSVASVITVQELMYEAKMLSSSTYLPLETFTVVAFIYFILIYPGTLAAWWLEKRLAAKGA